MRLPLTFILILLILPAYFHIAASAITMVIPSLEYTYVDREAREFSESIYINGTLYTSGSFENYIIVAAYKNNSRLWLQAIVMDGKASILSFTYTGQVLEPIVYSRALTNTSIWIIKVDLNGKVLEKKLYANIYPRFFPLTAIKLGDSIYIAGMSYIVGQGFNYMMARISQGEVIWPLDDIGSPGNDSIKCLTTIAGSRLLAAGDNTTSVSILVLSQTGELLNHYLLSYPNLSLSINGCLKISESQILLYGALASQPLLVATHISPDLTLNVTTKIIANITGVVTTAVNIEDLITVYITSREQTFLALYRILGNLLEFQNIYNLTSIAKGYIALSAAVGNNKVAFTGSNGDHAFIIALTINTISRENAIPRIPLLDILEDPRLTIALVTIILLTSILLYRRRRRYKM